MAKLLTALLGASFIVMKVMGFIDWNWVWVLSPIIAWGGLKLICLIIAGIVAMKEGKEPASDPTYRSKWEERFGKETNTNHRIMTEEIYKRADYLIREIGKICYGEEAMAKIINGKMSFEDWGYSVKDIVKDMPESDLKKVAEYIRGLLMQRREPLQREFNQL